MINNINVYVFLEPSNQPRPLNQFHLSNWFVIWKIRKNDGFIIEKNTMSEDTISQYKKYYL